MSLLAHSLYAIDPVDMARSYMLLARIFLNAIADCKVWLPQKSGNRPCTYG